ncbi:2437_t:CDS:2 [Entrophospora sp. SA101]|nr:2437_t:CDS:2 [Entrophospora sp. SA101]
MPLAGEPLKDLGFDLVIKGIKGSSQILILIEEDTSSEEEEKPKIPRNKLILLPKIRF